MLGMEYFAVMNIYVFSVYYKSLIYLKNFHLYAKLEYWDLMHKS